MIPKVRVNELEDVRRLARVTTHPFYEQNLPVLKELFDRSLMARRGQYPLLRLQVDLLRRILLVEQAQRRYHRRRDLIGKARRTLVATGAVQERIKRAQSLWEYMQDGESAARWFAERLRSIGDGVAWRFLRYDRVALRLLAEHEPISTPQLGRGLVTEVSELVRFNEREERPALLNSVTNFLRIGDITTYDQGTDVPTLVEVKTSGNVTARTRRQGQYRSIVQEALVSGVHQIAGVNLRKVVAQKPLKTYVGSVERAMREAEQRFVASRKFGDYLGVGVFATNKIVAYEPEERWPQIWTSVFDRLYPVRRRTSDILLPRMDNTFAITHFSPILAPYAIFPIDPRLRFALLSGEFLVMSVLNISGLSRWLEKRGWKVVVLELPTEMPEVGEFPYIGALQAYKGGTGAEIGLDILTVAALEFWMPESIEEFINAVSSMTPNDGAAERLWQVNFPNVGKYAWD